MFGKGKASFLGGGQVWRFDVLSCSIFRLQKVTWSEGNSLSRCCHGSDQSANSFIFRNG
jgi:hypothetical protein